MLKLLIILYMTCLFTNDFIRSYYSMIDFSLKTHYEFTKQVVIIINILCLQSSLFYFFYFK